MRTAGAVQAGIAGAPIGPTAIVAALPEEIAPLKARMTVSSVLRLDGRRVLCGRIGRAPVVLAAIGDGRRSAERGLERLLDAVPSGRVLAVGIAGGLTPDLGPGSLVVAGSLTDGDRPAPGPDATWLSRTLRLGGVVLGVSVTTERILVRAAEKAATARALGLEGPATVDLESAALARVAARRGIPFLSVRSVSDAAWEDLPLDFDALRGTDGGVSRLRVVAHALAHPGAIPGLLHMRRRVRASADRLATFVTLMLDGGPS